MNLEFGTIDANTIGTNVVSSVLYFTAGLVVLLAGFALVDVLTPGNLRKQVFVERRPNAVTVVGALHISLMMIVIVAINASADQLGQGLVDTLVFGFIGVLLQGLALLVVEILAPGRFRDQLEAERFHPAAVATAIVLLAVGGINAAAIS